MEQRRELSTEQRYFLRRVTQGSCPHAWIVQAPYGTGKRSFAEWCARVLLCTSDGDVRPCGVCEACRKTAGGFHPDIHRYGDGDKAVAVGDVRALIRETELVPVDGDRRVFILCHAERMQASAQNALLKVFEEPPAGVYIFLLTESRRALLPTVRSRGELLALSVPDALALYGQLRRQLPKASEEDLRAAVRMAEGSHGRAVDFLSKSAVQCREKADGWLRAALAGDSYRLLTLLTAKGKRENLLPQLDAFLRMLFDLLLVSLGGTPLLFSQEQAKELAGDRTPRALAEWCEAAMQARERLEDSGNVTAVMTHLALSLTGGGTDGQ